MNKKHLLAHGESPISNGWDTANNRCRGKKRFISRAAAKRRVRMLQDNELVPYHCSSCDGWHLGHDRRPNGEASGKAEVPGPTFSEM